jgi:hypothetical protein
MIPTRFKQKLAGYLSYPIGAKALSEALEGALHADLFTVSFGGGPVCRGGAFARSCSAELTYVVLAAEFLPARKPGYSGSEFLIEEGWYEEQWQLWVYPVTRDLRHLANRLLREQGLPLVVQWLRTAERTGWKSRRQKIELVFRPTEERILGVETSGV